MSGSISMIVKRPVANPKVIALLLVCCLAVEAEMGADVEFGATGKQQQLEADSGSRWTSEAGQKQGRPLNGLDGVSQDANLKSDRVNRMRELIEFIRSEKCKCAQSVSHLIYRLRVVCRTQLTNRRLCNTNPPTHPLAPLSSIEFVEAHQEARRGRQFGLTRASAAIGYCRNRGQVRSRPDGQ